MPPLWKSVLKKQLRLGILNNQFKKASYRSKYKCALFYILTKYYVVYKQNNRELILPSEVITNSVGWIKWRDRAENDRGRKGEGER